MKWHHKAFIFVFSVIIIALLVGVWRNNGENSTSSKMMLRAGTILTVPRTMPDFKFIDQHGETFTQEALHNRWTFLFFGYTHCPEICPETLRVLSKISEKVGHSQQIGFVFITIDPTHDTPERLTQFFAQPPYAKANLIGLTGEGDAILKLTNELGIYAAQQALPMNGAHIEHSGTLLLVNPEGKLTALFIQPDNPNAIVRDLKSLMHRYQQYH